MLHFLLQLLLHLCLLKSTYCISYFISDASLHWQFEFFLSVYMSQSVNYDRLTVCIKNLIVRRNALESGPKQSVRRVEHRVCLYP